MFKRIDHVEIIPSDFEKTIQFYIDILGFKMGNRMPVNMPPLREIAYLKLGDTMIEVISIQDPEPDSTTPYHMGYCGIALEVDNMDETVAYLTGKNIGIVWGPVNLGNCIRAEIRDPDGFTIELREWL